MQKKCLQKTQQKPSKNPEKPSKNPEKPRKTQQKPKNPKIKILKSGFLPTLYFIENKAKNAVD